MDLAVNTDLAHPTGNELGVLGTEVQNQDAVSVNIMQGHGISSEKVSYKRQAASYKYTPYCLQLEAFSLPLAG
ncbi:hypothetical protein YSKK_22160 [Halopseudomonas aestusnigri]|jgi:hypothetical protein|nr:hypothetical protein YSKK_22160 [Halopseudomonas aestusnigri]